MMCVEPDGVAAAFKVLNGLCDRPSPAPPAAVHIPDDVREVDRHRAGVGHAVAVGQRVGEGVGRAAEVEGRRVDERAVGRALDDGAAVRARSPGRSPTARPGPLSPVLTLSTKATCGVAGKGAPVAYCVWPTPPM